MADQPDERQALAGPGAKGRQYARLGASLLVDLTAAVCDEFGRDLTLGLVFLTLARLMPADAGRPPAPISTRKLAEAVDLPFDTVRRHMRQLRRGGRCETAARGVWIPSQVCDTPDYRQARKRTWALALAFIRSAERAGLTPSADLSSRIEATPQALRLFLDFFLDTLGSARKALDLNTLQTAVLIATWMANIMVFLDITDPSQAYAEMDQIPADDLRTPVSAYAVAKTLGLPYETVRRALASLAERGLVEPRPGGVIVPARVPARPGMMAGVAEVAATTRGLLERAAFLAEFQGKEASLASAQDAASRTAADGSDNSTSARPAKR